VSFGFNIIISSSVSDCLGKTGGEKRKNSCWPQLPTVEFTLIIPKYRFQNREGGEEKKKEGQRPRHHIIYLWIISKRMRKIKERKGVLEKVRKIDHKYLTCIFVLTDRRVVKREKRGGDLKPSETTAKGFFVSRIRRSHSSCDRRNNIPCKREMREKGEKGKDGPDL